MKVWLFDIKDENLVLEKRICYNKTNHLVEIEFLFFIYKLL